MAEQRRDGAEFEFHDDRARLFVWLDGPAFERVFRAVQESARIQDVTEIDVSEVWELWVADSSRRPKPVTSSWWKDRVILFGCGFAAFIILFLMVFGILAIVGLLPLPR
jgi:hypothetical protein